MAMCIDYNEKLNCEKHGGDQLIKKAISDVWAFLKEYIHLANTHGAEFISHSHWEKLIPSSIRQELLAMNKEELVNLPLGKFKTTHSKFKDVHGTHKCRCLQFESAGHIKKCVNHNSKSSKQTGCKMSESLSECDVQDNIPSASSACNGSELNSFVSKACECHLENLGVLTSFEEAMSGQSQSKSIIAESMSEKKSHEVKVMSTAVSAMVKVCGSDLVVDIGSGKGYLGTELADHQGIGVLGLDSCDTNTHGAKARKEKLKPRWSGLVAKEDRKLKSGKNQRENVQEYSKTKMLNDASSDKVTKPCNGYAGTETGQSSSSQPAKTVEIFTSLHAEAVETSTSPHSKTVETSSSPHSKTVETSSPSRSKSVETYTSPHSKTVDNSNLYAPLTMKVDPEMNLYKVITEHAAHICRDCKRVEEIKFILSGLHTCGSLAVSTTHLFVKNAGAVGMCCVGCCYQLLDEQNEECEGDFPLSLYGKSLNLHLGRNARNLASQSLHRLQDTRQLQGKDFYWRALLDVLLRDLSVPVPERIMGMRKLHKQCRSFYEYAVKALEKLELGSDVITPEQVQILEDKYQHEQGKMAAFFQFKLVLAPVIESLILLDRLLFLIEQSHALKEVNVDVRVDEVWNAISQLNDYSGIYFFADLAKIMLAVATTPPQQCHI